MATPYDPRDWLALHLLPGIGALSANRLLAEFPDPAEIAYRLPVRWLAQLAPRAQFGGIREARRRLRHEVDREWRRLRGSDVRLVTRQDPQFPALVADLPDAPVLLYVMGDLAPARPRVALVGARAASRGGREMATELARELVARGIEVVSGGAIGIDATAHRASLEAGGTTLAVLGSGLFRPYPAENGRLFERIAGQGALVSEFSLETAPSKATFPRRNRLISGFSAATVVIEAAARSGSLITANAALEQGREVLAVPGPARSSRYAGANRLIQAGAKLVLEIEDVINELPPLYRAVLPHQGAPPPVAVEQEPLSEDEEVVVTLLDEAKPMHVDELAAQAPLEISRLQTALFSLELKGRVDLEPGRYYLLRPRRER